MFRGKNNPHSGYNYHSMNMFTPTQAAALTGLSLKAIQKAVDEKTVPCRIVRQHGKSKRYLANISLICLRLEAEGLNQLPLQLRRRIFRSLIQSPREPQIRLSEVLCVDVDKARKGLATKLRELRRAERMVISNPAIMTGTPVVRGTRVPVHLIAELRMAGISTDEILQGYPSIKIEHISLAEIYAKAHPKRGRPPEQPWAGKIPVRRTRKRPHRAA
jgi:uncharacterized protein (DUF433 family)